MQFEPGSVTEAETRIFAEASPGQTQYYDQRPTGPSYLAPNEASPLQATPPTTSLSPGVKSRKGILIGSALVILLILSMTALALVFWARIPTSSTPAVPEGPPPITVQPPQPPPPPATGNGISSALHYPGAEVTMEMVRGGEGSVRQLTTKDSFDKVVEWYSERLKTTENVRIPGSDPVAILRGTNVTAVITGKDGLTTILLRDGIDQ